MSNNVFLKPDDDDDSKLRLRYIAVIGIKNQMTLNIVSCSWIIFFSHGFFRSYTNNNFCNIGLAVPFSFVFSYNLILITRRFFISFIDVLLNL